VSSIQKISSSRWQRIFDAKSYQFLLQRRLWKWFSIWWSLLISTLMKNTY